MKNFITFEGCEGVGKTTQLRFLKEYCESNGIDAVFTREPGGSEIAEKIRKIILDGSNEGMTGECEALLYAAARNQHINEVVLPALKRGSIVFCDRFTDSTYAYQGSARGLGGKYVETLNKLSACDCLPEYTVFLHLLPELAFRRKGGADLKDRLEREKEEFHEKVYAGYMDIISKEPERFIVIDASGSKTETQTRIISELIKKGIIK